VIQTEGGGPNLRLQIERIADVIAISEISPWLPRTTGIVGPED
jgi:hypothetical protein